MTGTEKYTWGIALNITGGLLLAGGIALSFTLIGACIGIPMALVGLPLVIWGIVWAFQGYAEKQREAIAAGVREGIQAAQQGEAGTSVAASPEAATPEGEGREE